MNKSEPPRKSLQHLQMTIASAAGATSEKEKAAKEKALFRLGAEAYALARLINLDISEHGAENQGLIELLVRRCKAIGVGIQRAAGADAYMYDFDAFAAYLTLAPRGVYAPEARFAPIEKSSFAEHRGPNVSG